MADAQNPAAPSTEGRRRDVLRAVSGLIADHGIEGMSMRQVADAVGMSTGTINYHFKNKRGLIVAAMDYVYTFLQPALSEWEHDDSKPVLPQLRRVADTFVLRTENRKQWWRFWLEYAAHAGRDADLLESHQARYAHQRDTFVQTLKHGIRSGELRSDLEPRLVADTLLALIDGLATHQVVAGNIVTATHTERLLDSYIGSLAATPQER